MVDLPEAKARWRQHTHPAVISEEEEQPVSRSLHATKDKPQRPALCAVAFCEFHSRNRAFVEIGERSVAGCAVLHVSSGEGSAGTRDRCRKAVQAFSSFEENHNNEVSPLKGFEVSITSLSRPVIIERMSYLELKTQQLKYP